ncbi:MAG TPA: hypothetical protein VL308_19015 [Gemmatimonadaceae bacterium]|jgi:hypothetical protein|nr:hypothetical protein [Gemmatimonadaceae bacterium]
MGRTRGRDDGRVMEVGSRGVTGETVVYLAMRLAQPLSFRAKRGILILLIEGFYRDNEDPSLRSG